MKDKIYVVSSRKFKSLKEAEDQLMEWAKECSLDSRARVYEVTVEYKPMIKLIKGE